MKKLFNFLMAALVVSLVCLPIIAHNGHGFGHGCGGDKHNNHKPQSYGHRHHHHNDSIDHDSIYCDSMLIYHHGHKHFKNDTISYDSLCHDTTATHHNWKHKHDNYYNDHDNHGNHHGNWHENKVDTFCYNNILYIDSVSVEYGTTSVVLPIMLANADKVCGVSFRLDLPEGIEVATTENGDWCVTTDSARCANHRMKTECEPNHELCVKFKSSGNYFAGSNGSIGNITVNIADSLTAGDYVVELSGVRLTDSKGKVHRGYTACSSITICGQQAKSDVFEPDEASGIVTVASEKKTKSGRYDINGKAVSNSYKGLVIEQGKKTFVK